jgi:hypothetical protein
MLEEKYSKILLTGVGRISPVTKTEYKNKIILGSFAIFPKSDYKFRRVCLSFCLPVCLSVSLFVRQSIHLSAWNNSTPTGRNLIKTLI